MVSVVHVEKTCSVMPPTEEERSLHTEKTQSLTASTTKSKARWTSSSFGFNRHVCLICINCFSFNSMSQICSQCGVNVVLSKHISLAWLWIISLAPEQFSFLHTHRLIQQLILTRPSRTRTSGTTNYFTVVLVPTLHCNQQLVKLLLVTPVWWIKITEKKPCNTWDKWNIFGNYTVTKTEILMSLQKWRDVVTYWVFIYV